MSSVRSKILIVDDEPPIRRFLRAGLSEHEFEIIECESVETGIPLVAQQNPDLILLDLGLPGADGTELIRRVREWSDVPIIILSARGEEVAKIDALDCGADDYVVKPFTLGELLARMRVAFRRRRMNQSEQATFEFGNICVDFGKRQVSRDGVEVRLTPLEYKLLLRLVKDAGRVLTHRQLLTDVWGAAYAKETHYLRVFMRHLREKLEADATAPQFLITEPGVGYRLRPLS